MNINNRKIIFFEPEMQGGMGHHMDNLIESSIYFKKFGKIIWITNKSFNEQNLFVPKFVQRLNLIETFESKNFLSKIIKLVKDIAYNFIFIIINLRIKKFKNIPSTLKNNFFTFPEYFQSFSKFLKLHDVSNDDLIIVQSCRPKDIELMHFALNVFPTFPKVILRVLYPPKRKKLKNFFYFFNNLQNNPNTKNKIKIFTEVDSVKNIIENELKIKINNFSQIYTFFNRKNNNELVTGFLGESRIDKGFDKLPKFIENLNQKNEGVKFIIQFSKKKYLETELFKDKIINLAKKNKNISIFNGYLDFFEYRNLLKKITIMPIFYTLDQINNLGSGLFYSCITHEIPMVIPKGSDQFKKYLLTNNYLEADNEYDYIKQIITIHENYDYFLNESKKLSKIYSQNIEKCLLVKEVKGI